MKIKILETILPPLLGILAVLGFLVFYNLMVNKGDAFNSHDKGFFKYFVPITTIVAIIIQLTLARPFWRKFKKQNKVWGMTLIQFTVLLCIISGLVFGFVFWETNFGLKEFILVSTTGIVAFAIYWAVNLVTLKQLDLH